MTVNFHLRNSDTTWRPYKWCDCLGVRNIKKCLAIYKGFHYRENIASQIYILAQIGVNILQLFTSLSLRVKMGNLSDLKGFASTATK